MQRGPVTSLMPPAFEASSYPEKVLQAQVCSADRCGENAVSPPLKRAHKHGHMGAQHLDQVLVILGEFAPSLLVEHLHEPDDLASALVLDRSHEQCLRSPPCVLCVFVCVCIFALE